MKICNLTSQFSFRKSLFHNLVRNDALFTGNSINAQDRFKNFTFLQIVYAPVWSFPSLFILRFKNTLRTKSTSSEIFIPLKKSSKPLFCIIKLHRPVRRCARHSLLHFALHYSALFTIRASQAGLIAINLTLLYANIAKQQRSPPAFPGEFSCQRKVVR